MRIKELFSVPNGTKVTEKAFGRVLISSICSIVLCMACLAGTSWAWFTAGIDSNIEIEIAPVALETKLTIAGEALTENLGGSYDLAQGEYKLQVTLNRENPKSAAYVLVSVRHSDATNNRDLFFTFDGNKSKADIKLNLAQGTASVNFRVTWIAPAGAEAIQDDDTVTVGQIATEPPKTTETTQPSEQPGTETTQPQQPADSTPESSEPAEPAPQEQPEAPAASEPTP